ncbi:shikimate kinase [Prochlorothrix hollandica]|uniref:Shikimate kinase n=1 Tax=Prochlorothrix hollandica PCC 9006 = CALU 1027 TaxID=317619 RepID=A0A0M2PV64_PROHO|nr:shikimate kinase [Prochlorothrix hollandica]KKI98553.1 shikimate kinase [Prochlorothrix hollandica PCC 9006 = CALU 1027]
MNPANTPAPSIAPKLKGLNVYLIGMMGVGKTTVGKVLAQRLGYRFTDTDALVEKVAGRSIPEIFATDGEAGFRTLESRVLGEVTTYRRLVVATGGGIVVNRENWCHLHQGLTVWLDVPLDVLMDRLEAERDHRPLLQTAEPRTTLEFLLHQRRPRYAEADLTVTLTTPETPDQTCDRLLALIPSVLKETAHSEEPDRDP